MSALALPRSPARSRPSPRALLTLLLTMALCLGAGLAAETLVYSLRQPQEMGDLAKRLLDLPLPGTESRSLSHLHPRFRTEVEAVLTELRSQGLSPRVSATWRSPRRQEALFALSALGELAGRGPATKVRGGDSCHNQEADGAPAAVAIDIRARRPASLDEQAAVYQALGRAAHKRGLRWGGDWMRTNPTWAAYGLGWDPAHLEARSLCQRLRAARSA